MRGAYRSRSLLLLERLSDSDTDAYLETISVLRAMERDERPRIHRHLNQARKLQTAATTEELEQLKDVELRLVKLLEGHKQRLLQMGAARRLLISAELEAVLPLEEATALANAKPISRERVLKFNQEKIEVRHGAQVRVAWKEGTVAAIFLGAAHDLTASVKLSRADYEYRRVTAKPVKELAD